MSDYTIPVRPFGLPTCYLPGRMVRDPELRKTGGGRSLVSMRIACGGGKDNNGNDRPSVFIDAVCWDEKLHGALMRLGKGAPVHASGELRRRTYTNRDGVEVEAWEVSVTGLHDHGLRDRPDTQRQASRTAQKTAPRAAQDDNDGWADDEPLPF